MHYLSLLLLVYIQNILWCKHGDLYRQMHFATSCRIYSTLLFVNMEPVCCGLLQSAMHLFIMVNGPGPSCTIPARNVLCKATTTCLKNHWCGHCKQCYSLYLPVTIETRVKWGNRAYFSLLCKYMTLLTNWTF